MAPATGKWAKSIGEQTYAAIDYLLTSQVIEEQAFRACLGILRCAEKYGHGRLNAACAKAIAMNSCTYSTITTILKNGQDKVSLAQKDLPTPLHENLRGSAAYV